MNDKSFSKSGMTRSDYRCNTVPGHSDCKKKIAGKKCPSSTGDMTDTLCHGHSHNRAADLLAAKQAISVVNTSEESVAIANTTPKAAKNSANVTL